jgi:hypothetical protein
MEKEAIHSSDEIATPYIIIGTIESFPTMTSVCGQFLISSAFVCNLAVPIFKAIFLTVVPTHKRGGLSGPIDIL